MLNIILIINFLLQLEVLMKVVIIKGPKFEETEKKVYQYLNKILTQKAKEIENKVS
jgi:hypothetical protein